MAIRLADKRSVPHTLLLADDSVTIQRVIELTFADEDIQVVAVSDGDQAIERLEATTPDIVLADIGMPGRNGYEVAQFMRRTPRLAHIPVVLLTGAFEPVDQERAAQAGCDGVLAKPFEPQMVIGRVRELLARPRAAAAADSSGATTPPEATAPAGDSRPQTFEASGPGGGELNAYFDRLDAAFANLEGGHPPSTPPQAAAPEQWDLDALDPLPAAHEPSRGSEGPALEPLAPVSRYEVPPPVTSFTPPVLVAVTEPIAPLGAVPSAAEAPSRSLPPKPSALPSLADAFAALLASEQGGPLSDVPLTWPATIAAPVPPAPVPPPLVEITEELVEAVTHRVLDRLSDRVVRETVSDIVSAVAERLISEEIARIKSAIE
jgi:CheY-like chemotaxis protein